MRNSINKTIVASLAAIAMGVATLGAVAPASANSDGRGNGGSGFSEPFSMNSATPDMHDYSNGRSYPASGFTAFYQGSNAMSGSSCSMQQIPSHKGYSDAAQFC